MEYEKGFNWKTGKWVYDRLLDDGEYHHNDFDIFPPRPKGRECTCGSGYWWQECPHQEDFMSYCG